MASRRRKKISVLTLLDLHRKAERETLKYRSSVLSPEDAAQEYICRILEGKHQHATVSQAIIDIHRCLINTRAKSHAEQRSLLVPVDTSELEVADPESSRLDERLALQKLIHGLDPAKRDIVELFLLGYTGKEIGKKKRISTQRVHQVYDAAIEDIQRLLKQKPLRKSS